MQRIQLDRPKLPRNREVRACLQCRNCKLKCDRSKPHCHRCQTNNRECTYVSKAADISGAGPLPRRKPDTTRTTESPAKSPSNVQQTDRVIWPEQTGLLKSSEDQQLRFYSSISWISALDDLTDFQPPESPSSTSTKHSQTGSTVSPSSTHLNRSIADLSIYEFASVAEVNKLVSYFAEYMQFFYPIVDIQEITGALHQHSKQQSPLPPEIFALVAAMCCGASSTLVSSGHVDSTHEEPDFWRDLGHRFLFASGYPLRPNMSSLRAAFLLSASSMTEWSFLPDPTPISVLIRAAQSIGLHRDPRTFQCSIREADFRRRLWWSIRALDVSYSLAHGLPPMTNQTNSDVDLYNDVVNPETRFLTFIARINLCFAKILEDIYGIRKPQEHDFQQLEYDAAELTESIAQKPQGGTSQDKFIALCARMCCDKVQYLLHQPYLRSSLWPKDSRGKALAAATNYIKDYTTTFKDPSLAQYRWILCHWNMFHPLAIILQDLTQSPRSTASSELRVLVDSTFTEFSSPSDHNWKRLQSLRAKAWKANHWPTTENSSEPTLNSPDINASLSDWDPLFASFLWDDSSPWASSLV